MKKLIFILALFTASCVTSALPLPAKVVSISESGGECELTLRGTSSKNSDFYVVTTYNKSYCAYQIGQEIK